MNHAEVIDQITDAKLIGDRQTAHRLLETLLGDIQRLQHEILELRQTASSTAEWVEPLNYDQATLDPGESDPATLWAEIHRLRECNKGPAGFSSWYAAAVSERRRRARREIELQRLTDSIPDWLDTPYSGTLWNNPFALELPTPRELGVEIAKRIKTRYVEIGYQYRHYDASSFHNERLPRWSDWEWLKPQHHLQTAEDSLNEMRSYISAGHTYQIRTVYATAAVGYQPPPEPEAEQN